MAAIIVVMRIAFLGLGLIGGSIARAVRDGSQHHWQLAAWTPGGSGPRKALEAGVIDEAASRPADAIEGADLVVLAAPPQACLELLAGLGGPLRRALSADAVITDVASTKEAVGRLAGELGLRFVGGHPMAGKESTGFESADPALFRDRPWVVVPSGDAAAVARVEALAGACGARIARMGAVEHDEAVAAISHMPLVLAAALVEAVSGTEGHPRPDWPRAAALAATGWQGMTRLARGDVDMATGIALTNPQPIAARLRDLRDTIDEWLALLEAPGGPDAEAIRDRLAAARARLEG